MVENPTFLTFSKCRLFKIKCHYNTFRSYENNNYKQKSILFLCCDLNFLKMHGTCKLATVTRSLLFSVVPVTRAANFALVKNIELRQMIFLCFSPIWQEILHSIHDKKKTNLALIGMAAT